jgi:ketosteroid isomerase-like protein
MSANLDLVRSIYADWERGDFSSATWADPGIEFVIVDGPSPGHWGGVARMASAWRDALGAYKDLRATPEHLRELDEERVLVLTSNTGRGRTSGLELGQIWRKGANVFHVRGGKVTRLVIYFEHERALADLGLAPEGDSP